MIIFNDRTEAGGELAARLESLRDADPLVLALPRGGVPVAAPIAERLGAPLDVLLIRKVGAPSQPELALGAVSDGNAMRVAINEDIAAAFGYDAAQVRALAEQELPELERRRAVYRPDRGPLHLAGRTVIVVDDGVATGATARAALELVRQHEPARLVLALPVAPRSTLATLEPLADETVCLATPEPFHAVGACYDRFDQVGDDEVIATLARLGGPDVQARPAADARAHDQDQ